MLQKPLDKHDVMPVVVVDSCCVPLAEAVCADVLIAKMIADKLEVVLNLSDGQGEQKGIIRDLVRGGVVSEELVHLAGDG